MTANDAQNREGRAAKVSRRRFLAATTLVAAGAAVPALALKLAPPPRRPVLAYVASYSSPQGPEGSKGNGRGIYLFAMDPASGALDQREVFANDANPSWLALNPARNPSLRGERNRDLSRRQLRFRERLCDRPSQRTLDVAQHGQLGAPVPRI